MARSLEQLDSVPWSRLAHAYGFADDVPDLLRALASDDDQERDSALFDLFGNIWHQGTVYEATAYAVPFLVEIALGKAVPGRANVLGLLGAIAESNDGPRGAHEEVARLAPAIVGLLADSEALVRAGAAYVLGSLSELAQTLAPQLRSAVEREPDALVRAGILLGLAYLRDSTVENSAWLERRFVSCTEQRERFATAFALAHSARAQTPEPAITLLANACEDPGANSSRFEGLPWDVGGETMPREALVAAGTSACQTLPLLLEALNKAKPVDASFLLEDVLAIVFDLDDGERSSSKLNAHQRRVLLATLDVPILWKEPNLFVGAFMSYELPTSRKELLAFLAEA